MTLELFLKTLIHELEIHNVKYCILRNYETLPQVLKQGDIDFFISEKDIEQVGSIMSSIAGIHIIGTTKRCYVHNYFLFNIDKGGDSRALQVDFVFKYIYKGVSYIDASNILDNRVLLKNKQFYIPSKFDEVFLMFLPFYLATGELNKKYKNIIIEVFQENEKKFKEYFSKLEFDINLIDKYYQAIINANNTVLQDLSREVKRNIFLSNFIVYDFLLYFFIEIKLRIPFLNAKKIYIKLNPENKNKMYKPLDSFAKNILFIDIKNFFDYLKLLKIQTNFTMYVFYNNDTSISIEETLNEIEMLMPSQIENSDKKEDT